MSNYIDLHTHSIFSDGTMTPFELVKYAHEKGLAVLSLTDHDSMGGVTEAIDAGAQFNITVIPGIEFNTNHNGDIHILGYFIDVNSASLKAYLDSTKDKQIHWVIKTLNKLKKQKIDLDIEKIINNKNKVNISSIISEMIRNQYVEDAKEAQEKYFDKGKLAYIEYLDHSSEQCIQIIRKIGGIPVLAHPMKISNNADEIFKIIKMLMKTGLQGIECYHPENSPEFTNALVLFCGNNDLCVTGGSDFHGFDKPMDLAHPKVPIKVFEDLLRFRKDLNISN